MDKNNDGKITWDEYLFAMAEWLVQSGVADTLNNNKFSAAKGKQIS